MSDLTVGKILSSLVVGAPLGASIIGVGNTAVSLLRLPFLTTAVYKALWKSTSIGPNLKVATSLLAPAVITLVPPTVCLASTIFGIGSGFYRAFGGIKASYTDDINVVKKFNEIAIDGIKELRDYNFKDVAPEDRFDIRIIETLRGLLCSCFGAPIEAIGTSLVVYRWWPKSVYKAYKAIWDRKNNDFLDVALNGAISVLVVPVALLALPLTPIATLLFGIGDMFYHGYKNGIRTTFKKSVVRCKDLNKALKEILSED